MTQRATRTLGTLLAAAALAALAACAGSAGTTTASSAPSPTIAGVATYSGLSHDHLHKIVHLTYPQTPPVGGEHAPYWLDCGVYTSAVPNEFAVHSMEHGAVWLTYLPDVPQGEVDLLVTLSKIRSDYVIVSPYPGQPAPIIATAWGLQLTAQSASDPRVKQFVDTYVGGGQGGEPGVSCAGGISPAQAQQLYKD